MLHNTHGKWQDIREHSIQLAKVNCNWQDLLRSKWTQWSVSPITLMPEEACTLKHRFWRENDRAAQTLEKKHYKDRVTSGVFFLNSRLSSTSFFLLDSLLSWRQARSVAVVSSSFCKYTIGWHVTICVWGSVSVLRWEAIWVGLRVMGWGMSTKWGRQRGYAYHCLYRCTHVKGVVVPCKMMWWEEAK